MLIHAARSISCILIFLFVSFSFAWATAPEKDEKDDKDRTCSQSFNAAPISFKEHSTELALSTVDDTSAAQSALIPNAHFGITGIALSYLPVREIIGIHRQYPIEHREVVYALSITPSPIFWNFHDPLYSVERFQSIFELMGSQGNIALKLTNLDLETFRRVAPLLASVCSLDISCNHLGKEGAFALAQHIPRRLQQLNVATNDFETEGLLKIFESLQNHEHLQPLNILWNAVRNPPLALNKIREFRKKRLKINTNIISRK